MFLGTHHHRLDSKGRLTLPSRFRPFLGNEMVVTKGPGSERCLYLFPMSKWAEITAKLDALPLGSRDARMARRLIMGQARLVTPDRIGRIIIPSELREQVGIQQEVVLVGLQTYVEIWSPEAWAEEVEQAKEHGLAEEQWLNLGI